MNRLYIFLGAIIVLLSPVLAWAQTPLPVAAAPSPKSTSQSKVGEPVPVIFWNRQITVYRSYFDNVGPAERASRTTERLATFPEVASDWNIVANETSDSYHTGIVVTIDGRFALLILSEDLDRESGETLTAAADRATAQLRAALEARSQQRRWPVILRGIALSLAATVLLILALWLLLRGGSRLLARMDKAASARSRRLKLGDLDLQPLLDAINRGLTKMTLRATAVVLGYLWLTFVLLRFPYSQPWGHQLGVFLINLFAMLGSGLLHSVPGIFTVVVIFLLARVVTRVVNGIFREIEKGDLKVSWLHPDTARATRRLLVVLVWIFAITVAYPYIPGSGSDAFKGISVFVGLMVTLGSGGLVNQAMSGLVIIYSRALRLGEFVQVGDDLGIVSEVGMLSTKIITRKREEITFPNAVLVGARTVNYSRHAAGAGIGVGTTVTIGYDVPWRQVHTMLLHAAEQTAGVRKDPKPLVWQKALSDFFVEYELVVQLDHPDERLPILTELHMHIQDAFNEQGVQIMVPHFEGQPSERVFVPKAKWFAGQGETPVEQQRGEQSVRPSSGSS
jgi:small-conductance mechanosensitive channel